MSFYRLQDADRDVTELLDTARQWSQTWSGAASFVECLDAEDYSRCADTDCVRCSGTGEYDDSIRRGVSVYAGTDGLAEYFASRNRSAGGDMYDADFLACLVLVELDGDSSDDTDHDAAEGAELIIPTRIVSVGPVPADMVATICGE